MKGRMICLETLPDGREAAALMVDGQLEDLRIDPPASDLRPQPEAIYRGIADRQVKGMGGIFVTLSDGQKGFVREARGISPGQELIVQISTLPERGKASPLALRPLFKSRYAIVTPDKPGRNISRAIRDEDERDRLAEVAHHSFADAPEGFGLILRSAAADASNEEISEDISGQLHLAMAVSGDTGSGKPELLVDAPSASQIAWRDWSGSNGPNFEDGGVWDALETLKSPNCPLTSAAWMSVEPTRALVAVDINTGGDMSLAAGLKANLAALRDLPRQLSLRGLGGQIVVDLAPFPKKERPVLESTAKAAFRKGAVDTTLVGWTPLGHLEFTRKRERLPLIEADLP